MITVNDTDICNFLIHFNYTCYSVIDSVSCYAGLELLYLKCSILETNAQLWNSFHNICADLVWAIASEIGKSVFVLLTDCSDILIN